MILHFNQPIHQLEKRRGGYFYLELSAETVNQFKRKKASRLICTLDKEISLSCGLNHLGDGNFFIIIAGRHLKKLGKKVGDRIDFEIKENPNPLGVEIPEVLQVLLEQDNDLKELFENYTDGKKRSLIFSIARVKDVDKQVQMILKFFNTHKPGRKRINRSYQ